MRSKWLEWAQQILSIAHAGLEYSKSPFDLERYEKLRKLSAEIVATYGNIDVEKAELLFASDKGYQTPKVDVRAIVHDHGRLLLVKEHDDRWALPGGWAEPNLSLRENVVKEVLEESGMEVRPRRVVAILDRNRYADDEYPYSVYKIFVQCDWLGGEFKQNIETKAARFFPENEIPELSRTRNTIEQIRMCFRHIRSEQETVEFD
ncbi:MAG TPA: NUDIX hydrolase [Spirochaetia bacterium]|nr:NUDIX hydrolase [Spirochaetia bacterium]